MAHVRRVGRSGGFAYEVRWQELGKFKQRTFSSRRDADRHAARVEAAKVAGDTTAPLAKSKVTIRDVVEASLEATKPGLKPRTYDGYLRLYRGRVLPEFGSRRLAQLTRADIQAWVTRLTAEGLAPATVRHCYVALRKAIRYALHDRLISYDPCAGVVLPKNHSTLGERSQVFLDIPQTEAVADSLVQFQPYGLMVRFMAYTGLRAGEVAGLRVGDVDLVAGHIAVRQTAQYIDGAWLFGTPKSRRSMRDVPLLDRRLTADLRSFMMDHPNSGAPSALFWPGRAPGSHVLDFDRVWDVASFRRNYFKPALKRTGLPLMRVHDLRHTAASLWLAAGFPPFQVSRWLGHASVVTTDTVYSHLYQTDYAQHVARFEAFAASA